jgi:V/A-type H+/Na+-transporting ATPase subunit E
MASEQPIKSSEVVAATAPQVTPQAPAAESAGVEMLIARLRDEGIAQGRSQAQALVTAAKQQAADIVAAAKREAEAVAVKANEEAKKLKAVGEDAIRLAMRDTMLSLEADLINEFQNKLQGLVKGMLEDPAFLQRLILEVAAKAAPSTERAELLIPAEIVSLEDLQRKPEEAKPGTLTHFVLSLGGGMLREGLSFGVTDGLEAGIRVKLVNENVQIDLTESAVSQLLLRHLLPRFRALLRGAVVVDHDDTKQPEVAANNRPAA